MGCQVLPTTDFTTAPASARPGGRSTQVASTGQPATVEAGGFGLVLRAAMADSTQPELLHVSSVDGTYIQAGLSAPGAISEPSAAVHTPAQATHLPAACAVALAMPAGLLTWQLDTPPSTMNVDHTPVTAEPWSSAAGVTATPTMAGATGVALVPCSAQATARETSTGDDTGSLPIPGAGAEQVHPDRPGTAAIEMSAAPWPMPAPAPPSTQIAVTATPGSATRDNDALGPRQPATADEAPGVGTAAPGNTEGCILC